MGLDSIWEIPKKSKHHPTFDPPLSLCGGVFSCYGKYSFRGKVYEEFILSVTGITLYQEEIPNTTIQVMSKKLDEYMLKDDDEIMGYTMSDKERIDQFQDLKRMFSAYAFFGASLRGWW